MRATDWIMSLLNDDPTLGPVTEATRRAREQSILDAVHRGDFLPLVWVDVPADIPGHVARVRVTADALALGEPDDFVRVNVSHTTAQQLADALGARLLTTKVADLAWRAAPKKLRAQVGGHGPDMGSKQAMLAHSARVSAEVERVGREAGSMRAPVGKHWVNTNKLLGRPDGAANYGWHDAGVPKSLQTLPHTYYAVTEPHEGLWQPLGLAHNRWHVDYCVSLKTRVLTADLRWTPAGELEIGQEIVGFDENLAAARTCSFKPSIVERTDRRMLECVEIETTMGTLVVSVDHRWATRTRSFSRKEAAAKRTVRRRVGLPAEGRTYWTWTRAEDLTDGDEIGVMVEPWEVDESREGGWMAGILDGEGWCSPPTGVGIGQNPGIVLNEIMAKLTRDGFELGVSANGNGCMRVMPTGPRASLRLLGRYRPMRLLPKARGLWDGARVFLGGRGRPRAKVLAVRRVGVQEVVALQTSTRTLVAEGLLSHNSQTLTLAGAGVLVDGVERDFDEIAKDPKLCAIVSAEGPLTVRRHPGVPYVAPGTRAMQAHEVPPARALRAARGGWPFIASSMMRPGPRPKGIDWIVLHETPVRSARDGAELFATAGARRSFHYLVDDAEIIACVREEDMAFGVAGANEEGVHVAIVSERTSAEDWATPVAESTMRNAARVVAGLASKYGIPLELRDVAALRARARGILTARVVADAWHRADRVDPGPFFPLARFLEMIRGTV